jgi:Heterokaryon incompatibility protein (HET)
MASEAITTLPDYVYGPVNSTGSEFRLLTIAFDVKQVYTRSDAEPLVGSLKNYYLPRATLSRTQRIIWSTRLPPFHALSYVWGEPARTHEIIIDNKRLLITANLYGPFRDLQRTSFGAIQIWADAICICQDDPAERSAQILLMREIYHSAAEVKIWLGPSTEDVCRCLRFIADLTGPSAPEVDFVDPTPTEDDRTKERVVKALMIPTRAFLRGGIGLAQAFTEIGDIIEPSTRDDKAEMLDTEGTLSLHEETIDKLMGWRPSSRHLRKVQGEDFVQIANLIDKTFIQNCTWFERMWVVQELGAAETASILSSGTSIRWDRFLCAVCYLHFNCNAPVSNIGKLTGLEKIRRAWNDGKRQPLRDLIRECRYRRATDP